MTTTFLLIAGLTLLGALLAVTLRNLIHCALAGALSFTGVAALFILLRADFLAAVQLLIYVGAVATLILFVVMLTRNVTGREGTALARTWWASALLAVAAGALLLRAVWLHPALPRDAPAGPNSSTLLLGRELLTTYVLPFEVVALLLTSALIGAIVVALEEGHRRGGPER